ncbi:MAG: HDOD domain-containing protein [Nitrospirae bacterium]|nr:HDOD domain-containing protein [Nitrospirota bacterium]
MMQQDSNIMNQAEKILETVGIPPQPKVLMDVKRELGVPNPNLDKVSQLVGKDISLTAMTIKVANSPMFGARKVDFISKSILFLGSNTFTNILTAASLKQALGSYGQNLDVFHNHSQTISRACAYISKQTRLVSSDVAYRQACSTIVGYPYL